MLKLRKNKKGFTLVELIVVIAIMAVLAGTVAGVTVSQLNKNTDKANLSQAKGIADFVAGEIADTSSSVYNNGELVADKIKDEILKQYASVNFKTKEVGTDSNKKTTIDDTPTSKGQFAVTVKETSNKVTSVDILYMNKAGGDLKGYTVSADGVITNYKAS